MRVLFLARPLAVRFSAIPRRAAVALLALTCATVAGLTLLGADLPPIVALPERDSPFIAFNVWVNAGSAMDPEGKEGLAALTANMIAEGATTSGSVAAIREKLYPMAADYSASVDKEMTNITGRVHRDNLQAYYELFKAAVLSPAFAESDFSRLKAQTLNDAERARRYSRDEELSKQLLFWRVFAGTPYAHPEDGYVSSITSLTLDDVKAFYRQHYTRNNVVAGVAGGYPDGFDRRLRQDLDALPAGADRQPPAVDPPPTSGVKVLLVDKEADASAISLGFPIDVRRNDPDFVPLLVANSYLGEHRNSVGRLFQAIRETRGMNYGDYSYIEAFPAGYATQQPRVNVARRRQIFEIWIRPISATAPGNVHDRTLFATRAALYEWRKLVDDGMTPAAVNASRDFLRNYVGTWGTTAARRLGYAVDDAFYGIPAPGFLQSVRTAIDKVTVDQVNDALRRHLRRDDLQIVIITAQAEALKQKLVAGTPTPIEYAGARPARLLEEDRTIAALPLRVRAEDVTILPIDRVFE